MLGLNGLKVTSMNAIVMVFNLKWGILDSVWFLCALKGKIIRKRPDTILSAISGFVGIKYKYIIAKLAV